ncbi:NupC/NupG family nucleoside CNT transporter [Jatrophihabitans fulvus]
MSILHGVLALVVLLGIAFLFSDGKRRINLRTVLGALAIQVVFAFLVLRWSPGRSALNWLSEQVQKLIGYAEEGTKFLFGPLTEAGGKNETIFALSVLPVIVFFGALIQLLFYLRVVQYVAWAVGGAIRWLLRTTRIESFFASVVIILGQSEAPLMIAPYLPRISRQELFAVMTGGFAAAAGSTLVGYSLLGAPLPYLLAASVMNAPASLMMAKIMMPTREEDVAEADELDVRKVRDEESANVIDALGRGALAGGRIAVTVGALLIAFVAVIAMLNAIVHGIGTWFGSDDLSFQKLLGWIFSPLAWLLGVPWHEATQAATYIGEKTVLNEFVAYSDFGPQVDALSPQTVVIVTFALAGFANFASIAIQIGTLGSLAAERRAEVAKLGLRALLAGSLANLANAAVAGAVIAR